MLNADSGTCDHMRTPKNRTLKGGQSEKIVDLNNQGELFPPEVMAKLKEPLLSMWYLCIFDDGEKIRAELSRPSEYQGGYVTKFSERIFILQNGDWEKVAIDFDQDGELPGRRN